MPNLENHESKSNFARGGTGYLYNDLKKSEFVREPGLPSDLSLSLSLSLPSLAASMFA